MADRNNVKRYTQAMQYLEPPVMFGTTVGDAEAAREEGVTCHAETDSKAKWNQEKLWRE